MRGCRNGTGRYFLPGTDDPPVLAPISRQGRPEGDGATVVRAGDMYTYRHSRFRRRPRSS